MTDQPASAPGRWAAQLFRPRHLFLIGWGVLWMLPPSHYTLGQMNDWIPFEVGARTLVHYHHIAAFNTPALHLYADTPQLQFGPLPILLLAAFQFLPPHPVAVGFEVAMVVLGVVCLAAIELVAREARATAVVSRRWIYTVELLVIAVWSYEIGYWHHLDDVLALTCLCAALVVVARQGPWWAFALLAGTAAATKPWAIIGLPLLLALPRRTWLLATAASLAVGLLWWLPFLVAAPDTVSAMGRYQTLPDPGSVLHLLGVRGDGASWIRPTQFAAGMATVALVVRRGRFTDALLAGMAVRIALDPFAYSYYILAPMLGALLVDMTRGAHRRVPWWTIATLTMVWLLPRLATTTAVWGYRHHAFLHANTVSAALRLAWALAVLAVLAGPWRPEGVPVRSRAARTATA